MNYSKRPVGTAATSPQLFETKQDPDPAHQHTNTHSATNTHTHMHKDTLVKNGVTGFHGAMRLTDRAGVLTCSQTTERVMERKRKGQRERERQRERSKKNKESVQ